MSPPSSPVRRVDQQTQRSSVRPKSPVGVVMSPIRLSVTSTTGSQFDLSVPPEETVEELVTRLSQSLRLPRDRIVLLFKERQLKAGKLLDLGVADESKLKLVPAVEAGFECQTSKTETSMMRSLESLTEAQISDFLCGRLPLTLSLGNGAHVMHVQLQLAVQNVASQQQHKHPRTWSDNKNQAELMNLSCMNHPGSVSTCSSTNTSGYPTTTAPSPSFPPVSHSPASTRLSSQRPATFLVSTPSTTLSNMTPTDCPPRSSTSSHSSPFQSVRTSPSLPSHPPPSDSPTLPASACSFLSPACSNPGRQSPAVAATFPECNSHPLSPDVLCQQPGAVIESLVNHSPGHFSGTFSGTLAPFSGINHPRRGIAIILQILNDLLSATRHHQAMTHTLPRHHVPTTGLTIEPDASDKAGLRAPSIQRRNLQVFGKTNLDSSSQQASTEENIALRCKMEELRFLMHQRRLHRRTRCSTEPTQTPHPYQCQRGRSRTSGPKRTNKCL